MSEEEVSERYLRNKDYRDGYKQAVEDLRKRIDEAKLDDLSRSRVNWCFTMIMFSRMLDRLFD